MTDPRVSRQGQYLVTRITTGPQDLLLMLDMQDERIDDPLVTALDVCPVYGAPDAATVRRAVLKGSDEANAEFGSNWYPLDIRFWYSGYDTRECLIASWASYNIVKALAQTGPDGIPS